jgi:hypothetical protein
LLCRVVLGLGLTRGRRADMRADSIGGGLTRGRGEKTDEVLVLLSFF